jgi:Family of unknown function (DUF5372)
MSLACTRLSYTIGENGELCRIAYPFHPHYGRELDVVAWHQAWRKDRVCFHDQQGWLRTVPWTSVVTCDRGYRSGLTPRRIRRTLGAVESVAPGFGAGSGSLPEDEGQESPGRRG